MMGYACGCGKTIALPRDICPKCGGHMEPVEISDVGEVLTFTTVHVVPEGFEAPIHLVLVGLERGAKLLCESETAELVIGAKGKVVVEDGKNIFQSGEE